MRDDDMFSLPKQKRGQWPFVDLGPIDDEYLAGCLERARLNEEAIPLIELLSEGDDGD